MTQLLSKESMNWINKVPEVTFSFWLIKIMSTTVGETAADFININWHLGLSKTSFIMGGLLAIALFFQIRSKQYIPSLYWITVVLISIFGTLLTDNLTDHFGVPLAISTVGFGTALLSTFILWYMKEHTLSIHSIDTVARETYYWIAILFTFALGTAAGDWIAEGFQIGYANALLIFGGVIALTTVIFYFFQGNAILCFWIAYILTRPFGASFGDLLSQPAGNGGLGLGTMGTSGLFLTTILGLVIYLSYQTKKTPK